MKKTVLLMLSILLVWSSKAQVYDFVVAKDGTGNFSTIQAAFDAVPTGTTRKTIFVKKGLYTEKVFLGSATVSINKVISLIGEDRDSVVISCSDYNGMVKPYYTGTSNITYGTTHSATLTLNAADFYMENITVANTSRVAQAAAIYNVGDRQTFKNCRFTGFQDTHYPKKGRRGFYYKTQIEGGTDFICGGGPNYFLQCTLKSLNGGSYITAPEDITYTATLSTGKTLYYGFVFKDCDLVNDGLVATGSVYLGRPWQNTSGSIFLGCRLGNHIRPAGWFDWGKDVSTLSLAEFKSQNASGSALADVTGRASWSMQLTEADVTNYLKWSKVNASLGSSTAFDPLSLILPPSPVADLEVNGQTMHWTEIVGVKGYVVYANGAALGFCKTGSYTDTTKWSTTPRYSVRTIGMQGQLSQPNGALETLTYNQLDNLVNRDVALSTQAMTNNAEPNFCVNDHFLRFRKPTDFRLLDTTGRTLYVGKQSLSENLAGLPAGIYILCTQVGNTNQTAKFAL